MGSSLSQPHTPSLSQIVKRSRMKSIGSDVHNLGLNPGCAILWLCDSGQVTYSLFLKALIYKMKIISLPNK